MRRVKVNAHPDTADILLRVSSRGQADADRYSLPTQEAACRAFCEQRGWRVHAVRQDAISGEYIERPGFQAILSDLALGLVGHVVVYDVDRAGRDTYVGATLLHSCKEAGALLHIQQMPDLELGAHTSAANYAEALFFMRLTQAQQEVASTRERTQRGRRARVASGKPIVSPVGLFGYQYTSDKTGYEPHPIYAPIVVRIYEEVAAGLSLLAICRQLNAEGIPTRSQSSAVPGSKRRIGKEWTKDAVSGIIKHPAYSGAPVGYRHQFQQEVYRDATTGKDRLRWVRVLRAPDETMPLPLEAWPPLVSPELAARARARLDANQQESARRLAGIDQTATLLRGGYAYCLACGRPMTTRRTHRDGKEHWTYYCADCKQSAYSADIDAAVWQHVEQLAQDETVAARALERWHGATERRRTQYMARLETARRVAAEAEADSARLLRAVTREDDERMQDRLRAEWREAVAHEEKAVAARDALAAEQANDPVMTQWANLQTWTREWCERIEQASYHDKRQSLHRLGLRVFIWPMGTVGGRAIRLREPRQFTLILGWPQAVRRAVPWLCEPLRETADEPHYLPGYLPGLQNAHSEVALLVAEDADAQDVTLRPGHVIGTRLGEALAQAAHADGSDGSDGSAGSGDAADGATGSEVGSEAGSEAGRKGAAGEGFTSASTL